MSGPLGLRNRRLEAAPPAPALVLGGVFALEGAAVLATGLVSRAGIAGAVALRVGLAAPALIAMGRPRLRRLSPRLIGWPAALGACLVVHHCCFYAAIHRLPLGVAVTAEFVGPLAVAIVTGRRRLDLLWAGLAGTGVAATAGALAGGKVSLTGLGLGLTAGAAWAAYIVAFPLLSARLGAGPGLASVGCIGALLALPVGVAVDGARMFHPDVVVLGVAVALLADVTAYRLQAQALSVIPARLFSVLTSTEPAAGALLGFVALGQHIGPAQWVGIGAVSAASIGASASNAGRPAAQPEAALPIG